MNVIRLDPEKIHLRVDHNELMRLKIALDEAMRHMDDIDLHARTGLSRAEAQSLMQVLSSRIPRDRQPARTQGIELMFGLDELIGLNNAMVYARYHMTDADQQRTGLHRAQAESLLEAILPLVREMEANQPDNEKARGTEPSAGE